MQNMETFNLTWIDYSIMIIYFAFVLGIGWALKKYMKNATDFLEAGRSLPAWVTGLAFISANLGALEVRLTAEDVSRLDELTKPSLPFPCEFLDGVRTAIHHGATIDGESRDPWPLGPESDDDRW